MGEFEIIPILHYFSLTDPWFPHKTGQINRFLSSHSFLNDSLNPFMQSGKKFVSSHFRNSVCLEIETILSSIYKCEQ
jgi:hypothetical protein